MNPLEEQVQENTRQRKRDLIGHAAVVLNPLQEVGGAPRDRADDTALLIQTLEGCEKLITDLGRAIELRDDVKYLGHRCGVALSMIRGRMREQG